MTNISEHRSHAQHVPCIQHVQRVRTLRKGVCESGVPYLPPSSGDTPQKTPESHGLDTFSTSRPKPSEGDGKCGPSVGVKSLNAEAILSLAQRQAAGKFVTLPLATSLAELRSPLEKSYRNTIYCAHRRHQMEDGKIRAKRCMNRWCIPCSRIRTAKAINTYLPIVEEWSEPYFITVTLPTVTAEELLPTLYRDSTDTPAITVRQNAAQVVARYVKRHLGSFEAIRKLECTARPDDRYHPHFHFIVNGRAQAELFVKRWIEIHDDASPDAQDVRPADLRSLKELFKYATKITTDGKNPIRPERLDVIYRALRDRRCWQPIGFKATGSDGSEELELTSTDAFKRVGEEVLWEWEQSVGDWIDKATGEVYSGHVPTVELRNVTDGFEREKERIEGEKESRSREDDRPPVTGRILSNRKVSDFDRGTSENLRKPHIRDSTSFNRRTSGDRSDVEKC